MATENKMTQPREHPILFNAEMVRAILDGKTQHRLPCKTQPPGKLHWGCVGGNGFGFYDNGGVKYRSPFGSPGDVLWVRETWMIGNYYDCSPLTVSFKADAQAVTYPHDDLPERACVLARRYRFQSGNWRPSIHMPKWACRIRLRVKRVWVERVQSISEDDAYAEGCQQVPTSVDPLSPGSYAYDFADLWDSIYAKTYPWESNPWVFACEFERMT